MHELPDRIRTLRPYPGSGATHLHEEGLNMECPKCQAEMESVRFEDIEVDRCIRCGGLWFDALEHDELRGRTGSEALDTGPTWQAGMHNVQPKVFCPRDGTLMVRMVNTPQPELWVESCPVCGGTFFDAGEFTEFKEQTVGKLLRDRRRYGASKEGE